MEINFKKLVVKNELKKLKMNLWHICYLMKSNEYNYFV